MYGGYHEPARERGMRLTIFAATGGIGRQVLEQAVGAVKATGVRRIIVVSAAPIGTVPSPGRRNPPKRDPGDGFFMRNLFSPLIRAALRKHQRTIGIAD